MSRTTTNSIVKWNPFNPTFSCYDSQLKLYEVRQNSQGHRETALLKSVATHADVNTLDWYQHISKAQSLAYGTASGSVLFIDWSKDENATYVVKGMNKYHSRPCTEVAWNKQISGHLAAGFEKLRKEKCAFVYDLESCGAVEPDGGEIPIISVSSDSAISLCWLPQQTQLLAVGNDKGVINIFDLRKSQPQLAAMTVMAHIHTTSRFSKKVKGIRTDPFNNHLLASFSDLGGEPVKVWDLRRVEKSKEAPVFTVHPHPTSTSSQQSIVTAVEYSPVRPGVLAVGTSQQDAISFFNVKHTAVDMESRVPVLTVSCPGGVRFMSWRGTSSVQISAGLSALGGSDMYHTSHGQTALQPDARGGAFTSDESKNEKNPVYLVDNHSIVSSQSVVSSRDDICRNRLLIANGSMTFMDVCVVEQQPLAVGALNDMLFGQGSHVNLVARENLELLECPSPRKDTNSLILGSRSSNGPSDDLFDIDTTMRLRCAAGYAIDSGKNLQTLYEELDTVDPASTAAGATIQLLRAWSWVDRVESLHTTDESFDLKNCGILQLLRVDKVDRQLPASDTEGSQIHPLLGCPIYASYRRSVGRLLCGWAALYGVGEMKDTTMKSKKGRVDGTTKDDNAPEEHPEAARLSDVVHEFEAIDNFERAAALALWHGDLSLAVKVLQRTVEACASKSAVTDDCSSVEEYDATCGRFVDDLTPEYIQLLSLVAMCIAGYGSTLVSDRTKSSNQTGSRNDSVHNSGDSMWASMCGQVLVQLRSTKRRAAAYLSAACQFLLEVTEICSGGSRSGPSRYSVVNDENIAFEDKVAFASTYLSRDEMFIFLRSLEEQCMEQGNIEGLVITGLNTESGLSLLQRYVDTRQDIQTAALLVARFPSLSCDNQSVDAGTGRGTRMESQFLKEYRLLLNRWQAFMERAAMDVELGYRYREYVAKEKEYEKSSHSTSLAPNLSTNRSRTAVSSSSVSTAAGRLCYQLPPHMDSPHVLLRCYYCSASLPVDVMQKPQQWQTNSWLRKQKPIMHCCPQCKRPLPKCYICLSYMGLVNPQRELMVALSQPSPSGMHPSGPHGSSALSDDASSRHTGGPSVNHSILEFGNWFMWCQHCKHGGHAGCMDSWFQQHTVCGVNGCNCKCETHPCGAS